MTTASFNLFKMFKFVQLVRVTKKSHCEQSMTSVEEKGALRVNHGVLFEDNNLILFVLPSVDTVRVAVQIASPAELVALQVYCPPCSEKASTMINVAVFVISSK